MMLLLTYFSLLLASLALVPVTVLLVQVLTAKLARCAAQSSTSHFASASAPAPVPLASRARVAVLVPAHNEAGGIAETVQSILAQLLPGDRVIVVADNCCDDTAIAAAQAGAEVIERNDAGRRGKGYALDFGMRHLEAQPPDVVLVIDADCLVQEGALELLARRCMDAGGPVQALYLMHAAPNAGLHMRIAEFAWLVKNQVRPIGWHRLGLPCQLMGTGMAFPWPLIRSAQLANGHLTEDMKLGLELAIAGFPAVFLSSAVVSSRFAAAEAGVKSQRVRWEHGHLSMILSEFPRLFATALIKRDTRLLGLALDLCVPPLALLVLGLAGIVMLSMAAALLGLSWTPLMLSACALGLLAGAILLAWQGWGQAVISLRELINIPGYVLSKIPLYCKFLIKRQKEWIRTERD